MKKETSSQKCIPATKKLLVLSIRERILNAAVLSLIELGTAKTTTLAVQHRAEVSRGALLHHFPSHAHLLAATVDELVARNEAAVRVAFHNYQGDQQGISKAVDVLALTTTSDAYLAELELWAVCRTDPELKECLQKAERKARKESERVLNELFADSAMRPSHKTAMLLTMEFLRGLALSSILRSNADRRRELITSWAKTLTTILETTS